MGFREYNARHIYRAFGCQQEVLPNNVEVRYWILSLEDPKTGIF